MNRSFNRFLPYLVILISAVILLGANPFKGETVAPTDILVNTFGWKNLNITQPLRHPARSDTLDARLPRWIHAKQALRNGELPLWNPYPINGTPGMQWLPAAILTPAFAVFALINDNASGYYYAMLTNLIIAAVGTYLLLLALTSNRSGSLFGSMVFAYSGFHASWFYWAHVTTSIWIPWLFLFAFYYLSTGKKRYLPWFSLSLSLMILGGFPSIVVYTSLAFILFYTVYAPWHDGFREVINRSVQLFIFGGLGLLIALFAIYSLYEMLQFTQATSMRHGGSPLNFNDFKRFYNPISKKYGDVEQTFYVGLLPLVLPIFLLPLLLKNGFKKNLIFAILLLTMTIIIAFSIIPPEYIKKIPTFNTNNWGRMSILLSLGFALLSAELIARFHQTRLLQRHSYISVTLIILLIIIQFADQKRVFNNFNGPVDKSTFLPATPTIEYVQNSLLPLQNVLADRIYLISGVLANYQIPEWLAHGFRTPSEIKRLKEVVSHNAFRTPTAVSLNCRNINYDVKLFTQLGIRYLLCKNPLTDGQVRKTIISTVGKKRFASKPIKPNQPLIQNFDLHEPVKFNIVSLHLATHRRSTSHADVTIKFYSGEKLKGEATVPASKITDNRWVDFYFDENVVLDKNKNRLEIHTEPTNATGKLSAWLFKHNIANANISHGGKVQNAVLAINIYEKSPLPEQITIHQIEPNMMLFENTNIRGSGYTLDQLDPSAQPNFSNLTLISKSPTAYEFQYRGLNPGWLVLPIRHYPGWQAYIGDKAVDQQAFLDMMPAIPVQPGDFVSYRYQPTRLLTLASISLVFLLYTIYLCFSLRRK